MARKLFNYLSELDEHISSSVFAFLQVPMKGAPKKGESIIGSSNAMWIPMDSNRDIKYVSPEPATAQTLEVRIGTTVEEMYRTGRSEFARVSSGGRDEASGAARLIAFENTNRAISDFAQNVADFDEEALGFVAELETGQPGAGENINTVAPKRFDVEELSRELDEAMSAISIGLGLTAIKEIKKRLVQKLLPNLDTLTREQIEEELEAEVAEVRRAAASGLDPLAQALDPDADDA